MGQQQNDSSSHNPVKTAGSTQTSNGQSDQEDLAANSGRVEKDSMDILLAALQDLNLPATIDRTDQPRKHTEDDVTIVIVSHEAEAWAVFFEDVTIETLYVHKAITAGAGGENTPDYPDSFPSIRVVRLLSNQNICPSDVEKSVTEFLMSENMSPFQKVVVKPYGFDWFGSRGVSFHPVSEVKAIVTAVLDLMGQIKTGEGVLVESFYATFDPLAVSVPGRPDTITKVNGDNSVSMSLELMLQLWGVRDTTQQREIHDVIKQKSERLLLELFEQERKVTVEERGGRQGEAACVWVQTMVSRSQRFLMQDKTVLVVGGGQYSKRNLWQDAKDFGVKIVMVDSNPNHLARNQVHHFLHVDTDDHTRDQEHADVIVKRSARDAKRIRRTLWLFVSTPVTWLVSRVWKIWQRQEQGVFSVGMMLTRRGPKLLEINARMGGLYTRDFIRTIYDVDLFHLSLMATCGIRPVASNSLVGGYSTSSTRDNSGQLIGLLLYPGRHGNALATTATPERLQKLHDQGTVVFMQSEEEVDGGPHEYESPFATLVVRGATVEETRAKFMSVCLTLGLETEDSLVGLLRYCH
nr:hypothetical protein BaRGS_004288 [Batillaria attramentaria]